MVFRWTPRLWRIFLNKVRRFTQAFSFSSTTWRCIDQIIAFLPAPHWQAWERKKQILCLLGPGQSSWREKLKLVERVPFPKIKGLTQDLVLNCSSPGRDLRHSSSGDYASQGRHTSL